MLPLVSHSEYADGTDGQTDRRQTVTLFFPLDAASVITIELRKWTDDRVCTAN